MERLGEALLRRGWITNRQLKAARERQGQLGGRLGTALLEIDAISEPLLLKVLSEQLQVPAADIEELQEIEPEVIGLLPARIAIRTEAIPFRQTSSRIDVAMLDVRNLSLQDELSFVVGKRLRIHIANEARIYFALQRYYGKGCATRFTNLIERMNRARHRMLAEAPAAEPAGEPDAEAVPPARTPPARTPPETSTSEPAPDPLPPPAAPPTSIPLSPEERAALGRDSEPPPPSSAGEEDRLKRFETALAEATTSHEVGAALLAALGGLFVRSILFQVRRGRVAGWMARGPGIDTSAIESFEASLEETSVFRDLAAGHDQFRGALAPLPAHLRLVDLWHGAQGTEALVTAVTVRGRLVAVAYGDRDAHGLDAIDPALVLHLAERSALALERCLLQLKTARA